MKRWIGQAMRERRECCPVWHAERDDGDGASDSRMSCRFWADREGQSF